MWDYDFKTGIIRRDKQWAGMLGYRPEDIKPEIGGWIGLVHPDELKKATKESNDFLSEITPSINIIHRMKASNGEWRWIHNRGKVVEYNEVGNAVRAVGTHQDITDQKKAEQSRLKLEAKIQQAQKIESLTILAGGVAHDFNNLLHGIVGNASLALMDLPEHSPVHTNIEEIKKSAKHAADLTKQMLAYSGKGTISVRPADLTELVREMSNIMKASISKKSFIRLNLEKDIPAMEADIIQIRQVLMNLITNASEAIGEKEGIITISTGMIGSHNDLPEHCLENFDLSESKYIYVEVKDTGCGMDEKTKERIFDPFFSTKFTGRGLGLAAVTGIIRDHNGIISVESNPGKGSTFRIFFPACSQPVRKKEDIDQAIPEWKPTGTVLLVDDEEGVRKVTNLMIRRIGFDVLLAKDGREALDIFRKLHDDIDIVLLDLKMPHMDGEEVLIELLKIQGDAVILLSSGYNLKKMVEKYSSAGLAGYIHKPYEYDVLAEKLKQVFPGEND